MDRARAARYGRAAARWARLLDRRPRAARCSACSTAGTRSPARASRSPAARRSSRSSPSAGRTARPTSRSSTSARRYLPRDLRPLLWLARRRRAPDRRQPGRRRLSRLGGRPHGRAQRAAPPRRARRPTTSSTRARSASARPTQFLGEPADPGRSSRTPSTSSASRPAPPPAGGPIVLLGGDQTQAYRLELALETFRHVLDEHPDARLARQRAARLRPGADARAGSGSSGSVDFVGRYTPGGGARRLPSRARPPPHEGQRPVPDDGDRGDGVRRARRVRGERRHGRAGRRRGAASASRTRTASSATSRRRPRRSPRRCRRCSPIASATPRARGARAVERFALADWLDRHAALFARARRERSDADQRCDRPSAGRSTRPHERRGVEARPRAVSSRTSDTSAPTAGRTSIRATARAG